MVRQSKNRFSWHGQLTKFNRWRVTLHFDDDDAFEPRSRRPKMSPTAIPDSTVEPTVTLLQQLSGQGLDAGGDTIAWHLEHHHRLRASRATIDRTVRRHGLVTPAPRKQPRSLRTP